jgi:hypothetical protein
MPADASVVVAVSGIAITTNRKRIRIKPSVRLGGGMIAAIFWTRRPVGLFPTSGSLRKEPGQQGAGHVRHPDRELQLWRYQD